MNWIGLILILNKGEKMILILLCILIALLYVFGDMTINKRNKETGEIESSYSLPIYWRKVKRYFSNLFAR